MINKSKHAILDISFVSHLRRIDSTCELIDYVGICANSGECIVDKRQYDSSPCNHYSPSCLDLNELISDEEAIEYVHTSRKIDDLERIYRDPVDVKIFIYAVKVDGSLVLSCDKNLLFLCNQYQILHGCFKAFFKELDFCLGVLSLMTKTMTLT